MFASGVLEGTAEREAGAELGHVLVQLLACHLAHVTAVRARHQHARALVVVVLQAHATNHTGHYTHTRDCLKNCGALAFHILCRIVVCLTTLH